MKDPDKPSKLLGLANRANNLTLGMSATMKSIHLNRCYLLLLAGDLAENARRKVTVEAQQNAVPVLTFATKERLGQITGRGELGIIGIADAGFARALKDALS